MAAPRLLQDPRSRQEGLAGGHQEGLPQARAPVPPGHEQGRRGRGALQADLRGLRRAGRPGEAQEVRPRAVRVRRRRSAAAAAGGAAGAADFGSFSDILSNIFNTTAGRGGARTRPAAERGRDLETTVSLSFDQAVEGALVPVSVATHTACDDLPRHGRAAWHLADRLPRVPGSRRGVPGPGRLLDHPPVLALRRLRHRDRGSVPDLRGRGAPARAQEVPRQHPRGRQGRLEDPPARQGRGGPARRPGGRPVRGLHTSPTRRSSGARATTSRSRCRSRSPRRCAAPTSRCRPCTAPRGCACRAAPGTARPAAARRGPPVPGGKGRGDIHYRFVIDVPRDAHRRAARRRSTRCRRR